MSTRLVLPHTDPLAIKASQLFPTYNGRKFNLIVDDTPLRMISYWDGGHRDYWKVVHGDKVLTVPENGSRYIPELQVPNLPAPGYMVFCHNSFGGQHSVDIYIHPSDWTPQAIAGPELTDTEKQVIMLMQTLSPVGRRDEAWATFKIRRTVYDATVEILKSKGLVAKNGGLTIDGKNIETGMRR